jgi:hypothetical protein
VRVTTTVAGAPFSLDATGIALRPFQAKARVTLRDVDATLANLYLPPDTMVVLDRAVVGAAVDATVDAQGGVGLDGQARIANLVARRRGVDASLFTVPALTFTLTSGILSHQPMPGSASISMLGMSSLMAKRDPQRVQTSVSPSRAAGRASPSSVASASTRGWGSGLSSSTSSITCTRCAPKRPASAARLSTSAPSSTARV